MKGGDIMEITWESEEEVIRLTQKVIEFANQNPNEDYFSLMNDEGWECIGMGMETRGVSTRDLFEDFESMIKIGFALPKDTKEIKLMYLDFSDELYLHK
jgi:hypothetical protein